MQEEWAIIVQMKRDVSSLFSSRFAAAASAQLTHTRSFPPSLACIYTPDPGSLLKAMFKRKFPPDNTRYKLCW